MGPWRTRDKMEGGFQEPQMEIEPVIQPRQTTPKAKKRVEPTKVTEAPKKAAKRKRAENGDENTAQYVALLTSQN